MLTNEGKSVDEILIERGNLYGSYYTGVHTRAQIVSTLMAKFEESHPDEPKYRKEAMRIMFSDLALKLMRFAANPMYEDSLQDLSGYAKLINDVFQRRDAAFADEETTNEPA